MMKQDDSIKDNDFVVRIRPFTVGDEWTGQIDVSIITSSGNTLDDESYGQLLHLTKMVCSTIPMMEQDTDLGNRVSDWVLEHLEGEIVDDEDTTEVEIKHEADNVVRLNFGTPTKGSA
jgi:hypothetical protein